MAQNVRETPTGFSNLSQVGAGADLTAKTSGTSSSSGGGHDEGVFSTVQRLVSTYPVATATAAAVVVATVAAVGYAYSTSNAASSSSKVPSSGSKVSSVSATKSSKTETKKDTSIKKTKKTTTKKDVSPKLEPKLEKTKPTESTSAEKSPAAVTPTEPKSEEEERTVTKPLEEMSNEERSEAAKSAKNRGNKYYQGGNYEKAIELYTEAIRLSPPNEHAQLAVYYANRAACYSNVNKDDDVIGDCSKALEYDSKYLKALNRRAQAYESRKDLKLALHDYTAVCILEGFQVEKTVKAADRVLKDLGIAEAQQRIKTRESRLPSHHFIAAYLGTFRDNDYENIEIPTDASPADLIYFEALKQVKERNYDQALELFEKALEQQTNMTAKALNWRGTFAYLKGDLDAALSDFNASLSLAPENINTLVKRGSIHAEKNDIEGSLADFKRALELDPDNAEIYYHRAQVRFLMDKMDEAVQDYRRSIELYDGIAFAHIQLAVSLYRQKKTTEAIEIFNQAEKRFPDSFDVFNYHGEILLDQQKFPEALEKFETALRLAPTSPLAYINKGLLVGQTRQDLDGAMALIKKAIEIDDRCDVAYAHLAQLHLQQSKITEAIENYEKAVDLTRTVSEMANLISCREAAAAQLHVIQTFGFPTAPPV